jgi:hypothetical protein
MTDRQENKLTMLETVSEYLNREEHLPLWQPVAALGLALNRIDGAIATIRSLADIQRSARSGKAASKESLNDTMITVALAAIGPVAAYANAVGDLPMRERFSVTRTDLEMLRDNVRPAAIESLHEEASELLAEQTATPPPAGEPKLADCGLTTALLTAMQSAVAGFDAVKNAPRDAQITISQATDALELEFDKADEDVEWGLDKMMEPFRISQPDFYNGYQIARRIIDLGVRHEPEPAPAPVA